VFVQITNLVVSGARQRSRADDIIGFNPSRRPNRKPGFRSRGEFARGLVVAAEKSGLRRRQIGLRVVSFSAIGHRELGKTEWGLVLPHHRGAQNRNRFVRVGLIIGSHEGLPK
jgi:hypothetical protein